HARGVVTATGMRTELGKVATLTQSIGDEETPLKRKLGQLGRQLGLAAIVVSALVALVGWLTGKPLMEMLMTGISLAVAAVPEGLPAVVTITLALGVKAMVRRRALLRNLQAAETLGAANVICTDKTGTLTKNAMTATRIWLAAGEVTTTGIGYDPAGQFETGHSKLDYTARSDLLALLGTGLVCNHATVTKVGDEWQKLGEPTEAALVVAAYKAWLDPDRPERVSELSFNSTRKRMTVVARGQTGALTAHVKGAPEIILERATQVRDGDQVRPITSADREAAENAFHVMAESGLRTRAGKARHRYQNTPDRRGDRTGPDATWNRRHC
ncbi:MAG: HAD-IC family P-type ATPase, partial [Hyphomicrobiaceae bacterium]